jgi:membrane dipeptidase
VGVNFHVGFLRADGEENEDTPIATIVQHIDYIAERIGVEHVGLGSDFDGATMPKELGDVTGLPRLIAALDSSGYDDAELRLITHGNWQRVLHQTWG